VDPGIWRYACWLTEDMLPELSHANVSTLASEETDSMLFHAGGFNPRECSLSNGHGYNEVGA
jgi:hypothetical protein